MNNQQKLERLLEIVDKMLENCDDVDIQWAIRTAWLRVIKDMCQEAIELIEEEYREEYKTK